uniref:Uncharacterized protein n=1 Tax=Brassica oleracea var. oleracea TaxID=109376 RepID=A0A0D3A1A9_BRAOL
MCCLIWHGKRRCLFARCRTGTGWRKLDPSVLRIFSFPSFLSLFFSPRYGERRNPMRSMGLFDATAASQWVAVVDDGKRQPLYLLLSSTKENGDISLRFFPLLGERGDLSRSVVLLDDKATSLTVAVVEEGKWLSLSISFLISAKNGELSLKRIERIKRRDQGFSDKSQTITHNKSHTIKSHMIKYHGSGQWDKNMREWRVERQTRPHEKNERDDYTQYDVSDFQQGEGSGSSHVDLTYSTDIPTNIANQMGVRTRIRDRQAHQQLKGDLVEHIWRKFGRDQDTN